MTLGSYLRGAVKKLEGTGLSNAQLDVRFLAGHVLKCSPTDLWGMKERPLSSSEQAQIDLLLERRAKGEPVGRILGCPPR
jgi:release factor glutamine methyltransferase